VFATRQHWPQLSHLVQLFREFAARKVALIIPSSGINTSGAPEVLLEVLSWIAAFKHSIAAERIRAGSAAAKARGVKLGRPVKIDAHRGDIARLRVQGLTGRAIAKEFRALSVFRVIGKLGGKKAAPVM
jgi:DNA invertase Pin-like site-specific DNA recombinase